jgi:hypothetical protein
MRSRIYSLLIGAAVAAAVTLPSKADASGWVNGPWKTYEAKSLKLDDVVGTVKIDVKDGGSMALQISGLKERVDAVQIHAANGTLSVECGQVGSVWDWRHWFDFSYMAASQPKQLVIHLAIPRGSSVDVNDLVGNADIGNTNGPMKFGSSGDTQSTIGNVSEAHLSLAGSGKLTVANVAGPLKAETAGSGDVKVGDAASVDADIAGSGSIAVGHVNGPLKVDIAGSGDFSAASVHGSTKADIAGSGSVTIAGGEANPFHVDIMGSGNVTFGGVAVDPKISSMGSGSVKLKAYRGTLSNDGMSNLKIGD